MTWLILNWLYLNAAKVITPEEWNALLNVEMIDADGWTREEYEQPCALPEYLKRLAECTIAPAQEVDEVQRDNDRIHERDQEFDAELAADRILERQELEDFEGIDHFAESDIDRYDS